jgi:hypothetical protein
MVAIALSGCMEPDVTAAEADDSETEYTCTQGSAFDSAIHRVIRRKWGRAGAAAISVAQCEGGAWGTSAWDYLGLGHYGLFQMGDNERQTFSPQAPNSPCAEVQAAAAHRYYLVAGWQPWISSSDCSGVYP